jgi:hypothetical protein
MDKAELEDYYEILVTARNHFSSARESFVVARETLKQTLCNQALVLITNVMTTAFDNTFWFLNAEIKRVEKELGVKQ